MEIDNLSYAELKQLLVEQEQCANYQLVVEIVDKLLTVDPINADLMFYKIKALDGLGKIGTDLALLEQYIQYRSTDPLGYQYLSSAYLAGNDAGRAIVSLMCALSVDPNNASCLQQLYDLLQLVDPKYQRVKLNIIITDRIGHLSSEIEPLMRKVEGEQDDNCLYLFISEGSVPCNNYLYALFQQNCTIIQSPLWYQFFGTRGKLLDDFFYAEFPYDMNGARRGKDAIEINIQGFSQLIDIYQKYPRWLELPPADIDFAWQYLAKQGIKKEDKIVCLHVRDSAYLLDKAAHIDFSYHDFRDAKLETYQPMIEALIDDGYTVIRIGAVTDQQLDYVHPKYFDFACQRSKQYGDFLEIFLLSECQFFVANYSGPYGVAAMFDTPTIVVNGTPFQQPYCKYGRFLPKRLFQNGNEVNIIDICRGKVLSEENNTPIYLSFNQKVFAQYGYQYLDNSAEDIKKAVLEFADGVNDRVFSQPLSVAQQQYYNALPDNFCHKNQCVISDSFLCDYADSFEIKEACS